MAAEQKASTTDMSTEIEAPEVRTTEIPFPEAERKTVQLVYILQAIGFFFGVTFIAAVILNYVKRNDITSDIGKSHFNYQIRTFWWSAMWTLLSMILMVVIIGYLTMVIAIGWTLYRVVKGFVRLNDGKAI